MVFTEAKRSGLISVRLRAWEYCAIADAARAAGVNMSEYLRGVALADARRRAQETAAGAGNAERN